LIFVDTNVLAETMKPRPEPLVINWLNANDHDLALSAIVVAEIAYGIEKIRNDERAPRLQIIFDDWRRRFAGRLYSFDEEAGLIYGRICGAAVRNGRQIAEKDGMIAAIALRYGAALATRNSADFRLVGLPLINPWESH
jgi:predicted nucleic acid-binding protein